MKWYGLLGKTLKHSFSKAYFTDKFNALGITDCKYENFELTIRIIKLEDFSESKLHKKNING